MLGTSKSTSLSLTVKITWKMSSSSKIRWGKSPQILSFPLRIYWSRLAVHPKCMQGLCLLARNENAEHEMHHRGLPEIPWWLSWRVVIVKFFWRGPRKEDQSFSKVASLGVSSFKKLFISLWGPRKNTFTSQTTLHTNGFLCATRTYKYSFVWFLKKCV